MALTDSLVSYWRLDEATGNATDSHGSNTLTAVNAPIGATGKINNGRDFETSSTQYLSHASNSDFQTGDIDFTFALWFKFESHPGAAMFLAKDVDSPASARDYTLEWVGDSIRFYTAGGGGGLATVTLVSSDLNWHFLVAWYTASDNNAHLLLDDSGFNAAVVSVPHVSSAEFRIGARAYSGFESYIDGVIDEVGYWKRTLTSGERTELWGGGAGLAYPFGAVTATRPDHYYRMLRAA